MRKSDWPVTADDVRSRAPDLGCTDCRQKIGSQHAKGCGARQRTVLVRTVVEHTMYVPEDMDQFGIEESAANSRCGNNDIYDLVGLVERLEKDDGCICSMLSRQYVREATEADEERCRMFISEYPVALLEEEEAAHI